MTQTKLRKSLSRVGNELRVVVTAKHLPTGLELSSDPAPSDKVATAQVEAKLAEALGAK